MLKQTTNHTNVVLFVCPRLFCYLIRDDDDDDDETHVCHLAVHNL